MRKMIMAMAFATMLLFGTRAQANFYGGYLCYLSYSGGSSVLGSTGYISANVYSGPGCTGSYLGGATWCSTGASLCTMTYSEPTLMSLLSDLRAANQTNEGVAISTTGTSFYVTGISFSK
jgi:hypothetical protein